MKFIYRVHEWAADRFSFIQYPNVRGPKPQFFKHQMPSATRLFIAVMSLVSIGVTTAMLTFLLFVAYSVIF